MPCIAVIEPSSSHTAAGCRSSIRHLRHLPEPIELLVDLAVSSSAEPLSPRALFPSVAAVTTTVESFSPPAMAWPWPQRPQLAPEPTVVLTATSGARSTHQFLP